MTLKLIHTTATNHKPITQYKLTFGKHKGCSLDDVPADYLLWLDDQDWLAEKFPVVKAYIEQNRTAIKQEAMEDAFDGR